MKQNNKDSSKNKNNFEDLWQARFNELCHAVFHKNQAGAELLKHLELKYFRSPVAYPNLDASYAYFNEGKNELIRSFTMGIQSYINTANAKGE